MNAKRFFIEGLNLKLNSEIVLTDNNYNYMVKVMRLKKDAQIIINNNSEFDYYCKIVKIDKKQLTLKVNDKKLNNNETVASLTVCQALVKNDKLDLITQKITELGAKELVPFASEFTVVKKNTSRVDRLNKIASGASSQCGRSKTLNISETTTLKELSQRLKTFDEVILAYEKATHSLKKVLNKLTAKQNIAIIVGSEGGFSQEEVTFLKENLPNLKIVSLGARILRAETASIVLSGAVMYELGELS